MNMRILKPLELLLEGNADAGEIYLKARAEDGNHVSLVISSLQAAELLRGLMLSVAQCPNEELRALSGLLLADSIHAAPTPDRQGASILFALQAGVELQQRLSADSAQALISELQAVLGGVATH